MAYCDYQHCIICDDKAFYDAEVPWESARGKEIATLCRKCAKEYKLVVVDRKFGTLQSNLKPWINDLNPDNTKESTQDES